MIFWPSEGLHFHSGLHVIFHMNKAMVLWSFLSYPPPFSQKYIMYLNKSMLGYLFNVSNICSSWVDPLRATSTINENVSYVTLYFETPISDFWHPTGR